MFSRNVQFASGGRNNCRQPRRSVREASDDGGFNGSGWPDFTWENGDISALPGRSCFRTDTFDHRCIRRRCLESLPLPRHRSHKYVNRNGSRRRMAEGQGSMLHDKRPGISRSRKSAAQDAHRDARSYKVFGVTTTSRLHQDLLTPKPASKGFANPMLRSHIGMCASLAAAAVFVFVASAYSRQASADAQQPGNTRQTTDQTANPQAP